jgi:hypothetical protein
MFDCFTTFRYVLFGIIIVLYVLIVFGCRKKRLKNQEIEEKSAPPDKNKERSSVIKKYPIRLMFGIGNNMIQGFSVVYEDIDGTVGTLNVWYDSKISMKFTNEDSFIILDETNEDDVEIKELAINRRFQNPIKEDLKPKKKNIPDNELSKEL